MARLGAKRSASSRKSFGFCPQDSEEPASISGQEQQGQTCILGRARGLPVMRRKGLESAGAAQRSGQGFVGETPGLVALWRESALVCTQQECVCMPSRV